MSSSCESSDSEASSQFSYVSGDSEVDVLCPLNERDTSTESISTDESKTDFIPRLHQQEKSKILSFCEDLPKDFNVIFPKEHVELPKPKLLVDMIKLLPNSFSCITTSMKKFLKLPKVFHTPKSVFADACVFSLSKPVMILTLAKNDDEEVTAYSSSLARAIMMGINKELNDFIICIHGVIIHDDKMDIDHFKNKIEELEDNQRLFAPPVSLSMNPTMCTHILKIFLRMVPSELPGTDCHIDSVESAVQSSPKSTNFSVTDFPPLTLSAEEEKEIFKFPDLQGRRLICPQNMKCHLEKQYPKLYRCLQLIHDMDICLVFVSPPNSGLLENFEAQIPVQKEIFLNVVVFDTKRHIMILTFAEQAEPPVCKYNKHLTRKVNSVIKSKEVSFIYGIIENEHFQDDDSFLKKIADLRENTSLCCPAMEPQQNPSECRRLLLAFLKYIPVFTELGDLYERVGRIGIKKEKANFDFICLPSKLTLVLFGKQGCGKSASGNTIIGKTVFKSMLSSGQVTQRLQKETVQKFGCTLTVVDTQSPMIMSQLTSLTDYLIIHVVRLGRYNEVDSSLSCLLENLGKDLFHHTLLLLCGRDDLDISGISIEKYMNAEVDFKQFVQRYNNRYVTFNNGACAEDKGKSVMALLNIVSEMTSSHISTTEVHTHCIQNNVTEKFIMK